MGRDPGTAAVLEGFVVGLAALGIVVCFAGTLSRFAGGALAAWQSVVLYLAPIVLGVLAGAHRYRAMTIVRNPAGHCRHCGYDLTGNVSGRCPECGTPAAQDRK